MRKRVILALVLVLALLASTSCKLIVKDEAVDRATPIIEVAGKTYTKGEINDQVNAMLDYYAQMYTSYGLSFDVNDEANIADMRTTVINGFIDEAVITEKITAGGYDQLTAEEQAEIEATAQEDYQLYYDTVEMFNFAGTELTGEELTKAVEAEMANQGYPTYEQLLENESMVAAQTKLRTEVVKDVAVTDEEIAAEYQVRADEAKANYELTPAAYGTDVSNGNPVYYTPAGYRYVKHVLISYSDAMQDAITDMQNSLSTTQRQLDTARADLEALAEDATAEAEELNATIESLTAEAADLAAQLAELQAAADAEIQPTVDEVAAKIAAGEDFNALIEQYNTDPGMTADSIGYPVSEASTNWVDEFKSASMALASVGDVSAAVPSSYGVHFIKYESDAAEGPVALETVKEAISAELLVTKQDEFFNATIDQWIEEAQPKVYEDRLK